MELEGSLRAFSLPEVLQFLAMGKLSGHLSLARNGVESCLTIREGKIVNSSSVDRPNKLGQMLVRRSVISRNELDQALVAQKDSGRGRMLGELLVERGSITHEVLHETIRLQTEEEIWDLFDWGEGNFKFEHDDPSNMPPTSVSLEIEPLLLEGSRRMDEWVAIRKHIPNDDAVFEVVPQNRAGLNELSLRDREWKILSLINGRFSVGSIIGRTGFGKFETHRIVYTLLLAGILAPINPREDSPPEARESRSTAPSTRKSAGAQESPHSRGGDGPKGFLKVGGFLGRRRAASATAGTEATAAGLLETESLTFHSPVGLAATYINRVFDALLAEEAFRLGDEDRRMLGAMWQSILNNCPLADLLDVAGGAIQFSQFEEYAALAGEFPAMAKCFEDSLEALTQIARRLFDTARQRLGEKGARRIFETLGETLAAGARLKIRPDFSLRRFVQTATD